MGILEELEILKKEITKKSHDTKPAPQKKPVSEWKEAYILTFKLADKKPVQKVQFSQALVGRTQGIGILQKLKGRKLGNGCVLVPAENLGKIDAFMNEQNVKADKQKVLLVE